MYRSNTKPPLGKSFKKESKKRSYGEDDELDPMDPSAYSDAPRGGWYGSYFLSNVPRKTMEKHTLRLVLIVVLVNMLPWK